jgi:very-short-patch-repair endonuclease
LDGKQHFEQIGKWLSPEETRKTDLYKMKCANENEFSIIRILQKDVYKNKYDWLNELTNNIEKITNEKTVQNIYMYKNNEYKDFNE